MPWINLDALRKIVVFGLVAGPGLPALFAVGRFSLSRGQKAQAAGTDGDVLVGRSAAGMLAAALCFLVVLAAVISSIIGWLRAGYPEGVPDVDYIPLFALLGSELTDEEVSAIVDELAATSNPEPGPGPARGGWLAAGQARSSQRINRQLAHSRPAARLLVPPAPAEWVMMAT